MKLLTMGGAPVKVLTENHELEKFQANVNPESQFVELEIGGETIKVGLKLDKKVFNHEDERMEDEELSSDLDETDDENSTENKKDKKTLMLILTHILGELPTENKANVLNEKIQRKGLGKFESSRCKTCKYYRKKFH